VLHSLNYKLSNPPFLTVPNVVIEAKYTLAKFINFSQETTFLTFNFSFFSFVMETGEKQVAVIFAMSCQNGEL